MNCRPENKSLLVASIKLQTFAKNVSHGELQSFFSQVVAELELWENTENTAMFPDLLLPDDSDY